MALIPYQLIVGVAERTIMRIALYARVSTEEQAIHGLSIEAQSEALEEWAKQEHANVVGTYIDAGISARKPASKRPSMQRLLADIERGKIDMVVFTKLDRWFRNIAEYYKVQDVLERHGVSWKTIHEDYDTATASGRFKVNIMLAVAQDEADRTSERIKAVFDSKRKRGEAVSGSVPPGIKICNKKFTVDEDKAPIMRDVFNFFIANHSVYATQRYAANTHGFLRDTSTLKRLLANPLYRGRVVDEATFDLAKELLSVRSQRNSGSPRGRVYLFKGMLRCDVCGGMMSGIVCKDFYYYRCNKHTFTGNCPNSKYIRESHVEQWLLERVVSECDAYNSKITQERTERPRIDDAGIRRKMSKLKDLYLSDLIDRDEYERDYTELKQKLEKAQEAEPPAKPIDVEYVRSAIAMYDDLERPEKKEFWMRIVKEIIAYPDGTFSFVLRNI